MKLSSVLISVLVLSYALLAHAPAMRHVQRGQYPYLVLIKVNVRGGSRYYTGTLLSLSWVLTLSENMFDMSVDDIRSQVTVFAGITRFSDMKRAQRRTVSQSRKTAVEGKEEKYPSMLILEVTRPFVAREDVQPVRVNNGYIQRRCVTAGWSSGVDSVPQLVQTVVEVFSTEDCQDRFNAVSYDSQICSLQSYEYSLFPGSALLCSNALTAVKSVDTYLSPFSLGDRIILYVRAKPFTTWMRSHVFDMNRMVVLPKGLSDNLMETWEKQPGFKRKGGLTEHPASDNGSNSGSIISYSAAAVAVSCALATVACK